MKGAWLKGVFMGVAAATAALMLRPASMLADKPLTEDAFYALAVSRNLAMGNGPSVDGETLTNGFQPLFTLICVPVYALLGGDLPALRGVLALQWLGHVGSALIFGAVMQRWLEPHCDTDPVTLRWLGSLAWFCNPFLFGIQYNGLESGWVLLGYVSIAWIWQRMDLDRWPHRFGLGVALGLLILLRIDTVFLVLLAAGAVAVRSLRGGASIAVVSFLISSPWWAYNQWFFGSLMPSSGTAQQSPLEVARIGEAAASLAITLTPGTYHYAPTAPSHLVLAILLLTPFAVGFRHYTKTRPELLSAENPTARFFALLVASTGILVVYYTATSDAVHFYRRYFSPLALVTVWITATGLVALYDYRAHIARFGVAVLCLSTAATAIRYLVPMPKNRTPFAHQLDLVLESVPKDAKVGAFQSGTLGYFRLDTINLDGKVNREALDARLQGRMDDYIREEGIAWLCEVPQVAVYHLGVHPEELGWTPVDAREGFQLWHRPEP